MPNFLNKKMSRRSFLKYFGLIILSLTGISGIISKLNKLGIPQKSSKKLKNQAVFGFGPYGGVKNI